MVFLRSLFVGLVSLASLGSARSGPAVGPKELLFYGPTVGKELDVAIALGYTTNVMTKTEWSTLTEADAKTYKAIVFGDPNCVYESGVNALLDKAIENRAVWSPAVTGNVILIGSDPTFHYSSRPGAKTLMEKTIAYVADEKPDETGLYMSLSCYYSNSPETTVQLLDQFGMFRVRGKLSCYDKSHIVATGGILDTLTDAELSNWACSVHEIFFEMPTDFIPLVIAQNVNGSGAAMFGDGTSGVPYIVARGPTPINCGNGKLDPGEECDDGNIIDGDGCSKTCKLPIPDKKCEMCSPFLGQPNECHITAPCSNTPYGLMCACRPGYKAEGPNSDTNVHWRLNWSVMGHEHRVYVKPGKPCDTLCNQWYMGPDSCLEISAKDCGSGKPGTC